MSRVLILSWEYPPLIEGGLARHVRKLSEALVAMGVEVHVLTRGGEESPADEVVAGVNVHRVLEPSRPRDLGEFVTWVERMNADMLAAGVELGDSFDFDLVHGHDWLVAAACDHLARRFGAPLVTTIHATEHGRHQGWVDKHPQSYIHGVERWITNRSDRVIACSSYMREQISDIFAVPEDRVAVIPNGIDPGDLPAGDAGRARPPARRVRGARREARPADRPARLREGLPDRARGDAGADRARPRHPLPRRRLGDPRAGAEEAGRGPRARWITAPSSAGSATTSCTSSTGSPTSAWSPRSTSPSASSPSRRWPPGCPCIVADTGGLREVVPHGEVGLRFRTRDPEALGGMVERVLTEAELRERLVAEASEHVLRFDWNDVARRTAEVYEELTERVEAGR